MSHFRKFLWLVLGLLLVLKFSNSSPRQLWSTNEEIKPPLPHAQPKVPPGSRTAGNAKPPAPHRYSSAKVIASRETSIDKTTKRRVEILQTQMKYPHIRVESLVSRDPATGEETIRVIEEIAADHVMVQLQPGKTKADLLPLLDVIGGTIRHELRLQAALTVLVGLPELRLDAVPGAVEFLAKFPEVIRIAEGDAVARPCVIPNDPSFSQQWHLRNTGQTGGAPGADIKAVQGWDIQQGNSTVIVAISDTGIDYSHIDLRPNIWTNLNERSPLQDDDGNGFVDDRVGWDFYGGDSNPMDDEGHGTQVAGIVGARGNNGIGVAGVAWNCKLMAIRTLGFDGGFTSDIADAFDYARRQGAHIINASHSGGGGGILAGAVTELENAGVLLVAASGNEDINIDHSPVYPACFPNRNIISVGFSTTRDEMTQASNYGLRNVDLAAPGIDILSTVPGNGYDINSGSSFAAPMVAGACALLKSSHPEWTHHQIRNSILRNADAAPGLSGYCATGARLNLVKMFTGVTTLATALDFSSSAWKSGGHATWFGETKMTSDGVHAAESGEIFDNQESWIETTVAGPGTLSFYWRVSSEDQYDILELLLDGAQMASISGFADWAPRQITIPNGVHTVRWRYVKDSSDSFRQDRGWVDRVSFSGVAPSASISPLSPSVFAGSSVTFTAHAVGTFPINYQWTKDGALIPGAVGSTFTVASVQSGNTGAYRVVVQNAWGASTSNPATLQICPLTLVPTSRTFDRAGGNGSFQVSTLCSGTWTATTTNSWIAITSGQSGNGNGVIQYSVTPNTTDIPRAGSVTVRNQTFIVTQFAELAPASAAEKTFTMVVSNGTGGLESSGSFQLMLSGQSNGYRKVAVPQGTLADAGNFNFTRSAVSNATLGLSEGVMFQLVFRSHAGGVFTATNSTGGTQSGAFTFGASKPDLNMDGHPDLLLQHIDGRVALWRMQGTNWLGATSVRQGKPAVGWKAFGLADFNNDAHPDIVFQHLDGRLMAWLLEGTNFLRAVFLRDGKPAAAGWRAVAANDFNNDHKIDVLLQHTDGRAAVWLMNNTNFVQAILLRKGAALNNGSIIVGADDFNRDGQLDILLQGAGRGMAAWLMIGTEQVGSAPLRNGEPMAGGWRGVALEDFNRDGQNDLLWQHSDGRLGAWLMQGTNTETTARIRYGQPVPAGWSIVAPR